MITIGANGDKIVYGIKHYNVDTKIELSQLNPAKEVMGTTAFVLENSKYYMVSGHKTWKEINPYGNGTGGGSIPEEVIYEGGGV